MTGKRINFVGKSLAKSKHVPEISFFKRAQYVLFVFLYRLLESLSNILFTVIAKLMTRKSKRHLTNHWQLIEEYFQLLRKEDSELDRQLDDEEDLYEYYTAYSVIVECSNYAEVRILELTRSQIVRWPRLFSGLSGYQRTRYNRFLHDKSKDRMRVGMLIFKMPNGSLAPCLQGQKPAIKLIYIRKKQN